jgi:hypothetical protein
MKVPVIMVEDEDSIEVVPVFEVVHVLPKREYDEEDPLQREYRQVEAMFLRQQVFGSGPNYTVCSVDIVRNEQLAARFRSKQVELEALGVGSSLLLFHGTPKENISSILENNFDLTKAVNGRSYGDGVYLTECPEVALDYAATWKRLPGHTLVTEQHQPPGSTRLLVCQVTHH